LRVEGSAFGVRGLWFRVYGLGFRIYIVKLLSIGFRVQSLGFKVQGSGEEVASNPLYYSGPREPGERLWVPSGSGRANFTEKKGGGWMR